MGNPLAIKNNYIWLSANLFEGFCQCRTFSKGEQTRDVRKFYSLRRHSLVGQNKIREAKNQGCGIDLPAAAGIRHISPGYGLDRF
jgi:hypothetical protein